MLLHNTAVVHGQIFIPQECNDFVLNILFLRDNVIFHTSVREGYTTNLPAKRRVLVDC